MAQFDKTELDKLTKDELVEEADRLGLPTKGTKAALIKALLEYDERDTNDDEDELDDDDLIEPDTATDEVDDDELDDDEPISEAEQAKLKGDQVAAEKAAKRQADAAAIKAAAAADEVDDDEEDDDLELDDEEVDAPAETPKKARAKKAAKPKAESEGDGTIPAKQVATILGVEAKTLRQFFRSPSSTVEAVGAGGRYEFTEAQVETIKSEFETWRKEHAARGQRRTSDTKAKGKKPKPEVVEIEDAKELDIEDEADDEIDDEELELEDDK